VSECLLVAAHPGRPG